MIQDIDLKKVEKILLSHVNSVNSFVDESGENHFLPAVYGICKYFAEKKD